MKPNVDLTLNRDFGDRPDRSDATIRSIAGRINQLLHGEHSRIPRLNSDWRTVESDYDLHVGETRNLMFTGNKEERAKKRFYDSEYDDTVCYCCGQKIKMPWQNRFRICSKCERKENRILWRDE